MKHRSDSREFAKWLMTQYKPMAGGDHIAAIHPLHRSFIGEIRKVDKENYTVIARVSDETLDRYEEVILTSAWKKGLKPYKKHPVLLSSHNGRGLTSQIGEAVNVWIEDDKGLFCEFKYYVGEGNQEADWGFKLCEKGKAAFSVGFMEVESEVPEPTEEERKKGKRKTPRRIYTEVELLEVSQVLIPANPNALMTALQDDSLCVRDLAAFIQKEFKIDLGNPNPSNRRSGDPTPPSSENPDVLLWLKDPEILKAFAPLGQIKVADDQTLLNITLPQLLTLMATTAQLQARMIWEKMLVFLEAPENELEIPENWPYKGKRKVKEPDKPTAPVIDQAQLIQAIKTFGIDITSQLDKQ